MAILVFDRSGVGFAGGVAGDRLFRVFRPKESSGPSVEEDLGLIARTPVATGTSEACLLRQATSSVARLLARASNSVAINEVISTATHDGQPEIEYIHASSAAPQLPPM